MRCKRGATDQPAIAVKEQDLDVNTACNGAACGRLGSARDHIVRHYIYYRRVSERFGYSVRARIGHAGACRS
jgi:hypothetical protein